MVVMFELLIVIIITQVLDGDFGKKVVENLGFGIMLFHKLMELQM